MRKFTLLIASLFITIGAMAQTNYGYDYPDGKTTSRDHHPISVSITGEDGKTQIIDNISTGTPYPAYFDKTGNTLKVVRGETVMPNIVINGDWMHGYVYVDWNRDDKFTVHLTGTGPYLSGDSNELVAYTLYNGNADADGNTGWNSAGVPAGGNQGSSFAEEFGSFTVPEGLEVGSKFRMRFTVMWNCIDPTGMSYAGNKFFTDGASIIDVTLEVVEEAADNEKTELLKYVGKANNVLDKFAVKYKDEQISIVGKISTNAGQNENNAGGQTDGGGLAALTDNNVDTYFHSRWGGTYVDADHYLQIDLGENSMLSDFCFEYSVRKGGNANATSPAPTRIEVRVSEDGTDFGDPIVTLTKNDDNLPSYADLGNTLWCSDVIETNKNVRYIRFTITDVEGPGNIAWDGTDSYNASGRDGKGRVFFGLSALNLYSTRLPDQIIAINEALSAAGTVSENAHLKKNDVNASVSEIIEVLKPYYYELNVSAAKYATMFLNFATAIPDVVKAYVVKNEGVKDKYITLTEVTGVIPAETGVIIEAEEGEYDFMASNDEATDVTGNLLKGTLIEKQVDEDAYILAMVGNEVGLYVAAKDKKADGTAPAEGETGTHFTCYANKAYLPASALTAEQQNSVGFRFDFGTTAVEKVEMRNEKEEIYDLQGRRINEITQPGIYVVNGVKRVVK